MKALIVALGAVGLMAGCASTAQEEAPPMIAADGMSPLSAPGYMAMASSSDLFEIESSREALARSQNPQVRRYAQLMIDHHSRTSAEMMRIAQDMGMAAPTPRLLAPEQDALDRVRGAGPQDFDAGYKREQIAGHQMALDLHRNYAAQGDAPAVRTFAARTAPIVEGHLMQAQQLPDYAPQPPMREPARAGERG